MRISKMLATLPRLRDVYTKLRGGKDEKYKTRTESSLAHINAHLNSEIFGF